MTKPVAEILLGDARFDRDTGELRRGDDLRPLRPQTARFLGVLADRAGEVVTKAELLDAVWPDTHVTEDSIVQCASEIRKGLANVAGVTLRTIPKTGYRLEVGTVAPPPARRGKPMVIALALILALAAGLWIFWPKPASQQTTIAVLPFQNMSGDPAQSYFSNGLAEDLIVDLSGLSDVRVISRGASFSLDPTTTGLTDIARILRADVVVEGSVRRIADSLRISVALVDGESGANLWARRYEGGTADVFGFQDEVAQELLRTLSVRLSRAERARLGVRGTSNVEAHDAYLRGRELENLYTRDTNRQAEAALQEALRLDPDYALPHAHLAQVYSFRVENDWSTDRDADIRAAFDHAETAVALDPLLPFAHFSLGRLYTRSFAPDEARAIDAYETAIRLDPNYDDAYVFLANIHIFNGRADAALPLIAEAFARNPLPPYWYDLAEGMAQYFLGDHPAAEARLVAARDRNPTAPYPYRFLIATYGQLGDVDEAGWMAMEYEALGRRATIDALLASASIQDPGYREIFADGFRKAGLPEK